MKCKNCDSMEIYVKGLCQKCYSKARYEANKNEIKARRKVYYAANKDKAKAYQEANKDKINARHKARYAANRDEISAQRKLYYEVNKDKISASGKLYYEANKDEINERNKLYRESHKDEAKLYYETTRDPNTSRMGSKECRIKMSCSKQGIAIEDFNGFTTEQKYCHKFNESRKNKIRNQYNNCDYISGIHKDVCNKGINLDVHHVDYNKQQGCDDHQWKLIPLSRSNHMKTNTNRPFWNRLFMYSLEIDKEYYGEINERKKI